MFNLYRLYEKHVWKSWVDMNSVQYGSKSVKGALCLLQDRPSLSLL